MTMHILLQIQQGREVIGTHSANISKYWSAGVHFTYPADRAAALKESARHIAEVPSSPMERTRLRTANDLSTVD